MFCIGFTEHNVLSTTTTNPNKFRIWAAWNEQGRQLCISCEHFADLQSKKQRSSVKLIWSIHIVGRNRTTYDIHLYVETFRSLGHAHLFSAVNFFFLTPNALSCILWRGWVDWENTQFRSNCVFNFYSFAMDLLLVGGCDCDNAVVFKRSKYF